MISIDPEGPHAVRATFRMRCGVGGHQVCVVGEFNDWSPTANPMAFDGHSYVAELVITTGRAYRFRYLVNGERWQIDWGADRFISNGLSGCDSILDLTKPRTSMLASTWSGPCTRRAASASNPYRAELINSV